MEKVVTLDYLLNLLQNLRNNGYDGNIKIKCQDNYLHEDEIKIKQDEIELKGYLFNFSQANRIKEFKKDIERAVNKYYGSEG